jgi:hypothetical protein
MKWRAPSPFPSTRRSHHGGCMFQSLTVHAGKLAIARDKTSSGEESSSRDDDDSSIWCLFFCGGNGEDTGDTKTVYVEPACPRPPPERIEFFYSKSPYFGGTSRFAVQKRWPAAEIVERSSVETFREPAVSSESAIAGDEEAPAVDKGGNVDGTINLPEGKSIVGADPEAGLLFVADPPRVETVDARPVTMSALG